MKYTKKRVYKKRVYKKKIHVKKPVVSLAVKKYVKKELHKELENKSVFFEITSFVGSWVGDITMKMTPLTPYTGYMQIPQGVGEGNRIGNTIRTRKVMLRYVITPNQYNLTTNNKPLPCDFQLFLGNVKQYKGVLPTASDVGYLFNNGNSSVAPTGYLTDLISPIDKDHWSIFKTWTHKVGNSIYNSSNGLNPNSEYFANNDYKFNIIRKMDITKYYPKVIKFDDSLYSSECNGLFFFYQAIAANGDVIVNGQYPMLMNYSVIFEYEDA